MNVAARPTIKALKSLTRGWTDKQQEAAVRQSLFKSVLPLYDLRHPLVEQAVIDTAAGRSVPAVNRILRCVRAATGEPWLEVKKAGTEWRGALTFDEAGTPWLVFATSHGHDAFYGELERAIDANGTAPYMPTEVDHAYLQLEQQLLADRAWHIANLVTAIDCVAAAVSDGKARCSLAAFPGTKGPALAELRIEVERLDEPGPDIRSSHTEDAMVEATLTFSARSNKKYEHLLASDLRALMNPYPGAWQPAIHPDGITMMYVAMISESRLLQLCAASRAGDSDTIGRSPAAFEPATHAHYAPRRSLAEAMVVGKPVHAICGLWFVPRHDHDTLPICPKCESDLPIATSIERLTTSG